MKKKMAVILAVTLVFILGVAQMASASEMFGMRGGGNPPQLSAENWQSQAAFRGLTDEQFAKIKEIQQNSYNGSQDLRARLQKAMFDLRQMRWDKNPDQNELNAAINEVNNLRSQLYQQTQNNREQMTSVLTQEQMAKIGQQGFGRGGKGFGQRGGMWGLQGTAQ